MTFPQTQPLPVRASDSGGKRKTRHREGTVPNSAWSDPNPALVGGEATPSPAGKAAASTPPSPTSEPPAARAPQESGKGPFPLPLGAALIALLLLGVVVVGVGSRVLKRTGQQ